MSDVVDIVARMETHTFQYTCRYGIASTATPPLRNQNLTASRRAWPFLRGLAATPCGFSVGACSPGPMPPGRLPDRMRLQSRPTLPIHAARSETVVDACSCGCFRDAVFLTMFVTIHISGHACRPVDVPCGFRRRAPASGRTQRPKPLFQHGRPMFRTPAFATSVLPVVLQDTQARPRHRARLTACGLPSCSRPRSCCTHGRRCSTWCRRPGC
jgi:hypothetical protein